MNSRTRLLSVNLAKGTEAVVSSDRITCDEDKGRWIGQPVFPILSSAGRLYTTVFLQSFRLSNARGNHPQDTERSTRGASSSYSWRDNAILIDRSMRTTSAATQPDKRSRTHASFLVNVIYLNIWTAPKRERGRIPNKLLVRRNSETRTAQHGKVEHPDLDARADACVTDRSSERGKTHDSAGGRFSQPISRSHIHPVDLSVNGEAAGNGGETTQRTFGQNLSRGHQRKRGRFRSPGGGSRAKGNLYWWLQDPRVLRLTEPVHLDHFYMRSVD